MAQPKDMQRISNMITSRSHLQHKNILNGLLGGEYLGQVIHGGNPINLPEGTIQALCTMFRDPGFFTDCMDWASDKGLGEGFCAALHEECTGEFPAEHE